MSRVRPVLASINSPVTLSSHNSSIPNVSFVYSRSFSTNPSLVGQLSTSKFLTPVTPITSAVADSVQSMTDLGFTYYYPSDIAARVLEFLHVQAGMPYIAAIVTCGFAVRMVLWYSMVQQQKFFGTLQEKKTVKEEIEYELAVAKSEYREQQAEKLYAELYIFQMKDMQDKKKVMPHYIVQSVFLIGMMRALRNCNENLPSFKTGGLPWSPDLSLADSTMLLPCITFGSALAYQMAVKKFTPSVMGRKPQKENEKFVRKYGPLVLPAMLAGSLSYSGWISSSLNIYFLTTVSIAMTQNHIIRMPALKQYFNMPPKYPPRMAKHLELSAMPGIEAAMTAKQKKDLGILGKFKLFWKATLKAQKQEFGRQQRAKQNSRKEAMEKYREKWEQAGKGPVPVTYDVNPLMRSANGI